MISKKRIKEIVIKSYEEVLEKKFPSDINIIFTGINSDIESIDIAQIIASIEDQIESDGIVGYDLLERAFEYDELSFSSLIDLLSDDLTN